MDLQQNQVATLELEVKKRHEEIIKWTEEGPDIANEKLTNILVESGKYSSNLDHCSSRPHENLGGTATVESVCLDEKTREGMEANSFQRGEESGLQTSRSPIAKSKRSAPRISRLLFNVLMSTIPQPPEIVQLVIYADDVTIIATTKSGKEAEGLLNDYHVWLADWVRKNN